MTTEITRTSSSRKTTCKISEHNSLPASATSPFLAPIRLLLKSIESFAHQVRTASELKTLHSLKVQTQNHDFLPCGSGAASINTHEKT